MNYSPDLIIATTVKRYLKPPADKIFWKNYQQLKEKSPYNLMHLIYSFISVNEMEQKLLQKGDSILFEYILALDGNSIFPKNKNISIYEKENFTPDDNEFYNRVIYENEIIQLKDEVAFLKDKLQGAIEEKKDFIRRDYKFIRQLGKGGFGTVSLVKHTVSNQLFAIKRLTEIDVSKQSLIKKEIETLASLGHPNIIGFRTAFNADNSLFLVMEYCEKGTLQDKLNLNRRLNEEEIVQMYLILTKTFEFLHQKKIVHHDIKPSNILFGEEETLKISDFGCANSNIGTKVYLPPEAHEKNNYVPNAKSDIFSLGVMLMECSLGYHPFVGKTVQEKIGMLKTANLPISTLPIWLQDTILKAMHYDPLLRFSSMDEFYEALIKRNIPTFIHSDLINKEKQAKRLSYLINNKKWIKSKFFIESVSGVEGNLNMVINSGNYYLKTHQLKQAKKCFETALKLNPQANIEKQIAEVYLQTEEPSKAASILIGYINRNFYDLEAHIQLLFSYFLSKRWELGYEQSNFLSEIFPKESIVENNNLLFSILLRKKQYQILPLINTDPFYNYYFDVKNKNNPNSWIHNGRPTLESKLIFQEYKFRNIENSTNEIEIRIDNKLIRTKDALISFGREGFHYNTFSQFKGNSVSRRHFVIVNMKSNVWLYDLDSTGVYVDGKRVNKKCFLLGLHKIKFGNYEIEINTDSSKLL